MPIDQRSGGQVSDWLEEWFEDLVSKYMEGRTEENPPSEEALREIEKVRAMFREDGDGR